MAAKAVLLHPQLFQCIVPYQDGVPIDLLPLPRGTNVRTCQLYASRPCHSSLVSFHTKWKVWLKRRSCGDVARLVRARPHFELLVLHHAAFYGVVEHLELFVDRLEGFPHLLELAAWTGQQETIDFLIKRGCSVPTSRAIEAASRNGHLEVVMHLVGLRGSDLPDLTDAMDFAAINGHLEVVRFIHDRQETTCTSQAIDAAASSGNIAIVRYLHSIGAPCTASAMDRAARDGHLDIVKFLHLHRLEGCTVRAMDWAAMNGHLEVLKFLHHNRPEGCTTYAMDNAACFGHLEIVRFLHFHRQEGCTSFALTYAAAHGHLEVVKFLRAFRQEGFAHIAMEHALRNGHSAIADFLRPAKRLDTTKLANAFEQACATALAIGINAVMSVSELFSS